MSLLEKLSNKIQYITSKQLDDPQAEEYARQQKAQKKQDLAIKKREQEKEKDDAKAQAKKAEEDAKAAELVRRSEFKPGRAIGNSATQILKILGSLVLVLLMLYGGHLAANEAIGYKYPFRILYFLYGALLFIFVIPKSFYDSFILKKIKHFYTFFPLSTYVPTGNLESFFLTPFCYVEDQYSTEARKAVEALYSNGLSESMKAVVSVTKAVGAIGLAVAANNSMSKAKAPESKAPEANVNNPEAPNVNNPEAPEAPEAPKASEAKVNNTEAPNVNNTEAKVNNPKANVNNPEPEVKAPETKVNNPETPNVNNPEPEVKAPETPKVPEPPKNPEPSEPEAKAPEAKALEAKAPEAKAPEAPKV